MPRAQWQPRRCNTDARSRCCASVVVNRPSDRVTSAVSSVDLAFSLVGAALQANNVPGEDRGESDPQFPSENFENSGGHGPPTQKSIESIEQWLTEKLKPFIKRLQSTPVGRVHKDLEEFFAGRDGYAQLKRVTVVSEDFYSSYFLFWELNRTNTQDEKRKTIVETLLGADCHLFLIGLLGHLPECCMVNEAMADEGTSEEAHESMWKWIREIVDKSTAIPECCDRIAKSWKEKEFAIVALMVDSQLVAKEAVRHIDPGNIDKFQRGLEQLMGDCWSSIMAKQQPEQNQFNQGLFKIYADLYNNSETFRKCLIGQTAHSRYCRVLEWVVKVCWALHNSLLDPTLISLTSLPDAVALEEILDCRPDNVTPEEHTEMLDSVLKFNEGVREVFCIRVKKIMQEAVETKILCTHQMEEFNEKFDRDFCAEMYHAAKDLYYKEVYHPRWIPVCSSCPKRNGQSN